MKSFRNATVLAVAMASLATTCAHAIPITLQPSGATGKDTQIDTGSPNTNWEGSPGIARYLVVNWGGSALNARSIGLLEFDVSSIPAGATINSATLSLYHELNLCALCQYDVFRVTSAWTENTVTYNTAPTMDLLAWASLVIPAADVGVYRSWDVTSLVSGWIDGSFPNFGMWIEEIPVQGAATAYFASSDSQTLQFPILEVDYSLSVAVPEPGTLALFGAGLAGLALIRRRRKVKR